MRRGTGHAAADDVLVAVTTLSFDIAGLETVSALLTGGQRWSPRARPRFDGRLLRQLLEQSGATIMQATPYDLAHVAGVGLAGRPVSSRCWWEAKRCRLTLAHDLATRCGSVWNMYGPTETTIWSTCVPGARAGRNAVPIGRPIANTHVLHSGRETGNRCRGRARRAVHRRRRPGARLL